MIVLQLTPEEADAIADVARGDALRGDRFLIAWDPIDRAIKVKDGIWSRPLGTVIVDD